MKSRKWTIEELEKTILVNSNREGMVIISALFKKLYGKWPELGLNKNEKILSQMMLDVLK